MDFNYSLELNQSQKLVMTQQLKQSLNILNMSKMELDEEIKKESLENPLLEYESNNEINWEEYAKSIERTNNFERYNLDYSSEKDIDTENMIMDKSNLYEQLHMQLSLYKLEKEERKICKYIIDSLDKDGYLRIDKEEILFNLNIDEERFKNSLDIVKQLEPSGVGARDICECLKIQLINKGIKNELLDKIIENDLGLIARNKFKDISKKYKISIQECVELIDEIKTLEPKPGRCCLKEETIYVKPDVIVKKYQDEFIVYTSKIDSTKIEINNFYKEILKNSQSDEEAKKYIKEKLNSATDLIKNIDSRKNTILKIAKEIVKYQGDFFNKGHKYLKPMRMKDIAKKLELHESTISRGVNNKYMLTPYGLFEFKYFFSAFLKKEDNETISNKSIKTVIKEMINSEDKKKPYSDEKISNMLKVEGIKVARRTVAKYREEMNIEQSSLRKKF